jgi:hypothetical protein
MRRDPKSLSDEELARLSAKPPLESRLETVALLGGVAAFLLLFLAAIAQIFVVAFLAAVAFTAAASGLLGLIQRPKRTWRKELGRRRGKAPFSSYVDEARAGLAASSGEGWVILFIERCLPHGPFIWMRVAVTAGPRAQAEVDLRASVPARDGPARDVRFEGALADEVAKGLLAMLSGVDLAEVGDVPSFVYDGAPCRLAILRQGAEGVGSCNLGGLSEEQQGLPTAAFCVKLAGAAQDLLAGR